MSELNELYQELIIDHGRKPRNFGALENASHQHEGFNPLCGDRVTVYLSESQNKIQKIQFVGAGCAISMASASLMTEILKERTLDEAQEIFKNFHALITGASFSKEKLGKLVVLAGVTEFPARVKCAALAWHTLMAALQNESVLVSTEGSSYDHHS